MNTRLTSRKIVRGVAAAVAMVTLLSGCLSSQQTSAMDAMNRDRKAYGRHTLSINSTIQRKAQAWAEQLARDNYLHHSTLTAGVPSCWRSLGENVGYGGSISAIEKAYMNSPAHRSNILNAGYTTVGIGVATRGSRIFTVQVFMSGC